MKLTEYRWWVHLWSDSDGMIQVEIPGKFLDSSTNIKEVGDQIQIFDYQKRMKGYFSKLSKFISINTFSDFFDGTCKEIK